jgi:CRISPR system Cascade subunit CasE
VVREGAANGHIHRSAEETHPLCLLAVRFDGLLQVADPARLQAALRQGIGSGKGLGFGLLSLAPA